MNTMKKLLLFLIVFLISGICSSAPFFRQTKHKPIKRMTTAQVRKAQKGETLYTHKKGKVVKNRKNTASFLPFYNRKK